MTSRTRRISRREPVLLARAGAWDLNFFYGGLAIGNSADLRPVTDTSPAVNADVLNLSLGDTVGPSPTVGTYPAGTSGSTSHIGTGTNEFLAGQSGILGFRLEPGSFTVNSTGVHYGFMSVVLNEDGSTGLIEWWAWETDPDTAVTVAGLPAVVPEASEVAILALGLLGLAGHRRRRRS